MFSALIWVKSDSGQYVSVKIYMFSFGATFCFIFYSCCIKKLCFSSRMLTPLTAVYSQQCPALVVVLV